ncbi:transcriptional regulator [Escherichia coli]|nr:transcriptional regulator [Escherichia coli]
MTHEQCHSPPKNGKPALSPHHDWLKTGSQRQNAPLRIWFYPQ